VILACARLVDLRLQFARRFPDVGVGEKQTRRHLVAPEGDAVAGALQLARAEADPLSKERVA
jgi:hypothetical protein